MPSSMKVVAGIGVGEGVGVSVGIGEGVIVGSGDGVVVGSVVGDGVGANVGVGSSCFPQADIANSAIMIAAVIVFRRFIAFLLGLAKCETPNHILEDRRIFLHVIGKHNRSEDKYPLSVGNIMLYD